MILADKDSHRYVSIGSAKLKFCMYMKVETTFLSLKVKSITAKPCDNKIIAFGLEIF